MAERGGGSVINQSSTAAWKAQGGYYGVAKLGVQGLTMCLASELGEHNIRVNAIAPGPTDTEATRQVPAEILDQVVNGLALKRLGDTTDIVNMAMFLASEEAAWITGQTFRVDGGDTMLPA
jgi:NAD(P)-dependent dehydrogenase (short-subunit alcohol dehydrogenase family)